MKGGLIALLWIGASLTSAGCGLKFTPSPMNLSMPKDLLTRTHLANSAAYQANLGALAGHVLYVRKLSGQCPSTFPNEYSGLDLSIETYVKDGEQLEPRPTATPRYESKITRGAALGGTVTPVVLSIASKLSQEQASEVVVSDVYLPVRDDQVDLPKLLALDKLPLPDDVCARLFVRGVALETIIYKDYVSIAADATTNGAAFAGEGKVYSTTNQFAQAFSIAMDLQRITQATKAPPGTTEAAMQVPPTLRVPDGGFRKR